MNSKDYKPFHIYHVLQLSSVRHEPSLNSEPFIYAKPGAAICCVNVFVDTSGNTWIKNPIGWMIAIYNGEVLIK